MKSIDTIIFILAATIATGLLYSCEGSEKPLDSSDSSQQPVSQAAYIKLSAGQASSLEASPAGDEFTIKFSTNKGWKVSVSNGGSQEWISINQFSGNSGECSIVVSIKANETESKRDGTVNIAIDGSSVTVSISQDSGSLISGASRNEHIGSMGGTVSFNYKFQGEVSMSIDSDWISLSTTKAMESATAVFDIAANNGAERKGNVVFSCGNNSLTFTIIQDAFKQEINVSQNSYVIDNEGGDIAIRVYANVEYESSVNVPWIKEKKSTQPGTHVFEVMRNESESERSGVIVFCNDAVGCIPVSIKQKANAYYLELLSASKSVSMYSGKEVVEVRSNTAWTAESDAEWCSLNISGGEGDGYVTLLITENDTRTARQANITFKTNDGSHIKTFILEQSASGVILELAEYAKVGRASGKIDIDVKSNTLWDAVSNASWCTIWSFDNDGTGNGTITLLFDENSSRESRVATITVKTYNGEVEQYFRLEQSEAEIRLSISEDSKSVGYESGKVEIDIASNYSWAISSDESWCYVLPYCGTGDCNAMLYYGRNDNAEPRSALVTFKTVDGNIAKVFKLEQTAGDECLRVWNYPNWTECDSGLFDVLVESNTSWKAVSDVPWCTVNPSSGRGDTTVRITYDKNLLAKTRTANIKFITVSGNLEKSFSFIQYFAEEFIEFESDSETVGNESGSLNLSVKSNTDWTVSSNSSWCTLSKNEGSCNENITLYFEKNGQLKSREATIEFITSVGYKRYYFNLRQRTGEPTLDIDNKQLTFGYQEGSVSISVHSNTDWAIKSNAPWCRIDKVSGNEDGVFEISVSKNTQIQPRTTTVEIWANDGRLSKVIGITQEKAPASLELTSNSVELDYVQNSKTIKVFSNAPWTAAIEGQSWCSISSNVSDNSITINASDNLTGKDRYAKITVSTTVENVQKVIMAHQKAKSGNEGWESGENIKW